MCSMPALRQTIVHRDARLAIEHIITNDRPVQPLLHNRIYIYMCACWMPIRSAHILTSLKGAHTPRAYVFVLARLIMPILHK